ncbi:hypothetical protein QBC44DRAFT_128303 [Cladorrhinum sp. PSN332]|nr:hypothetical protein QBC44DRAFT_128303 [Cladorrhinum sp. PSN332]
MEFSSGQDLISMKETLQRQPSLSTESPPSNLDPDEYARQNGLTIDYFTDPWSTLPQHDAAIAATLIRAEPGQLVQDALLQECCFRPIISTSEQWEMPPESLAILHDSVKRCKVDEVANLMDDLCFIERANNMSLKYDPPLLRSDHEEDCRRLTRRVNVFRKVPLSDHHLPIEPADVTKGEGLEFPGSAMAKDKHLMKSVQEEKLNITHDNLKYLMDSLKAEWTERDQKELIESTYPYRGIGAMEPLTPPLSPMIEPPVEHFVPDQEACYIPDPSDPSSDLSADILAAESRIFRDDRKFWAQVSQSHVSPGRYEEVDISEMLRAGQLRSSSAPATGPEPLPRDFHVEVPVFPSSWHDKNDPTRQRVLTSDDLHQMRAFVTASDMTDETDGPLVDFFKDRAINATRRAEQEQLQPLDATSRVLVPLMDFTIPRPDWEEQEMDPQTLMRQIRKKEDVDWQGPKWHCNRALEQKMVWAPLAHMKRKSLVSESIELDPEVLNRFLGSHENNDAPTSADYVHKTPGLAILRMDNDDDDDDEYITPLAKTTQPSPPLAVSEKPPVVMHASVPTRATISQSEEPRPVEERAPKRQKTGQGSQDIAAQVRLEIQDGLTPPSPSTQLLTGYESRFPELGTLISGYAETHFPRPPETDQEPRESAAIEAAPELPPPPEPIPAIAPDIVCPTPPPQVIISSTLSRPVAVHLETLLPGIEVITRDYGAHAPQGWAPGMRSPNLDDADITISPSTGILLSTMVKLRQRPVPGQTGNTVQLQQILQNVAVRYERLVVIISEGNKHSEAMTPLSQGDAKALVEFQGFAMGLDTKVRMLYVGGGVETLAKWTAKTICDHGEERPQARRLLLPGQSYWEVFLHRAGMNVFAAQVVLGILQGDDDQPAIGGPEGEAVSGLPFFVQVPLEDRILIFADLLGGQKILERVSQAIDEPWGQLSVDDS